MNMFLYLGSCQLSFTPMVTYTVNRDPIGMATGDFNGDNRTDILVTNFHNNTISVLLGYGNGSFAARTTFLTGYLPIGAAVSDFNGDNRLDVVVTNSNRIAVGDLNNDNIPDLVVTNEYSNSTGIYPGDGNGNFSTPTTFPTGGCPSAIVFNDFNSDGRQDLAFSNNLNATVGILLNLW
jgi:hypothetical protein